MKVVHICHSDSNGGAARAAFRLHNSLIEIGVSSTLRVGHSDTGGESIVSGRPVGVSSLRYRLRNAVSEALSRLHRADDNVFHSYAWPSTGLGREIRERNFDVVHLHWLGRDMLSVEEIGELGPNVVWTLHDMWAFCGAEHLANPEPPQRFTEGYVASNCPVRESRFDMNRLVWKRKTRSWKRPINIVCPSRWMMENAKKSKLFGSWPMERIANPLNMNQWRPIDKQVARSILGLSTQSRIVMMGAYGGLAERHKGHDLGRAALELLVESNPGLVDQLLLVGDNPIDRQVAWPIDVKFMGKLRDQLSLVLCYSAADAVIVPSRIDNLPSMAIESLACGTPVAGFATGGLTDIVKHAKTGWLAQPFDVRELSIGIHWLLADSNRSHELSLNSRRSAIERFCSIKIANQYKSLYKKIVHETDQPRAV